MVTIVTDMITIVTYMVTIATDMHADNFLTT